MKKKHVVVSVTNHLVTDQRVHRTCTTLHSMGFKVTLVGRKWPSDFLLQPRLYSTKRFLLPINKGFLFYAFYNIRLFFYLLFTNTDVLLSNDLDTLPANFLVSRIKRIPLVYDSHEYFTEVPELINRPRIKKIWEKIERFILPRIKNAFTVSDSIAKIYKTKYNTDFKVIRNLPEYIESTTLEDNNKKNIVLYQGALNMGRGLEKLIEAMPLVENAILHIIGDGDITNELKERVAKKNLSHKVVFVGRVSFMNLREYTCKATIGVSLEEDMGLNYRFALPNKLFDYIHAGLPVLVSPLPEMKKMVEQYNIGIVLSKHTETEIASALNQMLSHKKELNQWSTNAKVAAQNLCWQKEEIKLKAIFATFI
ncbi:MAG: glycosyltransferase [Flavobacteriales bacterium]|nr:glycosyltransferase [Flavobacteriales bacterium]